MRGVTIGPLRALHWPASGRQAPQKLLAIHGVWVGAPVWNQVGPYLASHGYETYAVWLRHHQPGADPRQLAGLGLQDYADDVAAVVRDLGAPVLLGHSMGGLLAQLVATATEPSGLALLASAPPFGIPVIPRLSLVVTSLRHFIGRPLSSRPMRPFADDAFLGRVSPGQRAALTARRVPEPRRLARQLAFVPPIITASHVRCPVWVAGGDEDPVIRPWVTRRIAARYGVRPSIYRGGGHMLNLESGWSSVADDLIHWVERCVST
ncbi:MAG: alpha/beta fold hydrolase [Chloroflexota bacterium]|nr:alpha/beta fold hydrolase [Chloroflexota bacterium]